MCVFVVYFKQLSRFFFYIASILTCVPCVWAEEASIFHEIAADLSWTSHEESYDHYTINGETSPRISGNVNADSQYIHGSYSFFFTPILEGESIPIALRRFYAHPTTLSLQLAVSPEHERTYTHNDPDKHFQSETLELQQSRSAGVDLDLYVLNDTALVFSAHSTKIEGDERYSSSVSTMAYGENDEIRRSYGLGVSHYFLNYLQAMIRYTFLDSEYASLTTTWDETEPLTTHDTTLDADSKGGKLTFSGRYAVRNRWGIQGVYQYTHSTTELTMVSWHDDLPGLYQNPASRTAFDADTRRHNLDASVDFYWNQNVTFRLGGGFADYKQETRHGTAQATDYDWDRWTAQGRILYYISRHLGMWIDYEVSKQDGFVNTWFPNSQTNQRTTYQRDFDWQVLHLGIAGRF